MNDHCHSTPPERTLVGWITCTNSRQWNEDETGNDKGEQQGWVRFIFLSFSLFISLFKLAHFLGTTNDNEQADTMNHK